MAGVVATAAMSSFMLVAQKAGLLGRMPPRKISDRFLSTLGVAQITPEPARRAFATASHFGFGAACGAVFGVGHALLAPTIRARLRSRSSLPLAAQSTRSPRRRVGSIAAGIAFGTAVWAVSYAGWVPALRIMPPPRRDRPGRPTSMVLAHWIFGGVLGSFVAR